MRRAYLPATGGERRPLLSGDGFEGPLDWLVEQARARRIDLQRLSALALVDTFEVALLIWRPSMAIFDRLKDAARTTNSIDFIEAPASPSRVAPAAAPASAASEPTAPGKRQSLDAKAAAYTTEPEAISRAYYVEDRGGERRYYADYQRKNLAIQASDTSISTKNDDLNTIRAMVTLAEARGWSELKVAGTADFRREAWIEAQARGVTARGYKATDLDQQEADRRRSERGSPMPAQAAPAQATNEVKPVANVVGQVTPPSPLHPTSPTVAATPPLSAPQDLHRANPDPKPSAAPEGPAVNARRVLKEATAELSPDGKLVLAALSEKIDRQMNKLNADAKLETKAFAAAELVKKERAEGPVTLSAAVRQLATSPGPAPAPTLVQTMPVARPADRPQDRRRSR